MTEFERMLDERDLRYKRSDFYGNPIIGKEVCRFSFLSPKFKGHAIKKNGEIYFDDVVMSELKWLAEKNSGGFCL